MSKHICRNRIKLDLIQKLRRKEYNLKEYLDLFLTLENETGLGSNEGRLILFYYKTITVCTFFFYYYYMLPFKIFIVMAKERER